LQLFAIQQLLGKASAMNFGRNLLHFEVFRD